MNNGSEQSLPFTGKRGSNEVFAPVSWILTFLFLLLFNGTPNSSAHVKVVDEIRETQQRLEVLNKDSGDAPTQAEIRTLNDYIEFLNNLKNENQLSCENPEVRWDPTGNRGNGDLEISHELKSGILALLKQKDSLFKFPITLEAIYLLFRHIETHKNNWIQSKMAEPYVLKDKLDRPMNIHFEIGEDGQIYLEFPNSRITQGSTMALQQVTAYGSWARVAQLSLMDVSNQSNLRNMQKFLKVVMQLPQKGLVQTYHVGKQKVIQAMYRGDLLSAMSQKSLDPLNENGKLELLEQFTTGLSTLHQNGICHGDLKYDNLLVGFETREGKDTPTQLVIGDYDNSYFPKEKLHSSQAIPTAAIHPFAPPEKYEQLLDTERFHKGWIGETDEEKIKNALKADVFGAGTIIYQLMKQPKLAPWVDHCVDEAFDRGNYDQVFSDCQKREIKKFQTQVASGPYNPLDSLISSAIEVDPQRRISSSELHKGIEYLLKRMNTQDHTTLDEQKILSDYESLEIKKITYPKEQEQLLTHSMRGAYIVHPMLIAPHSYRLGVSYTNGNGKVQILPLQANPSRLSDVKEELDFLRDLGILRENYGHLSKEERAKREEKWAKEKLLGFVKSHVRPFLVQKALAAKFEKIQGKFTEVAPVLVANIAKLSESIASLEARWTHSSSTEKQQIYVNARDIQHEIEMSLLDFKHEFIQDIHDAFVDQKMIPPPDSELEPGIDAILETQGLPSILEKCRVDYNSIRDGYLPMKNKIFK